MIANRSTPTRLFSALAATCGRAFADGGIVRWLGSFAGLHILFTGVAIGKRKAIFEQAVAALVLVPALYGLARATLLPGDRGGARWMLRSARELGRRACNALRSGAVFLNRDKVLITALALALIFGAHGMNWGRVECWNPDQMILGNLGRHGVPKGYAKPPLLSFVAQGLVIGPIGALEGALSMLHLPTSGIDQATLLGCRLLVIALYLCTICLVYETALLFFGIAAARFAALAMATGAGFAISNHFLTCDSALLMPMMGAFYFSAQICRRGKLSDYVLAGIFTGLAFNMKYNGLAVGIAIPVAHFLAPARGPFLNRAFAKPFLLSLLMVVAAALATNPFMILDYRAFKRDFLYNYAVTSTFGGLDNSPCYIPFLKQFFLIFGFPGTLLIAALAVGSIVTLAVRRPTTRQLQGFLLALAVFLLYYAKFGSFHRTEMRFSMPCAPFILLLTGPAVSALAETKRRFLLAAVAIPTFAYSAACSYYVGTRFENDPRMGASQWLRQRLAGRSDLVIESSQACPNWYKWKALGLHAVDASKWDGVRPANGSLDIRMPPVGGLLRTAEFMRVYANNKAVLEELRPPRDIDASNRLFTQDSLAGRKPDYIVLVQLNSSLGPPAVRDYYNALLSGNSSYRIAFDATSPQRPSWLYPKDILFVEPCRTVIFDRQ